MERRTILDFIQTQLLRPPQINSLTIYGEIPNYFAYPYDWKIEVLKCLAIGEEQYRIDPIPVRVKNNKFFLENYEKFIEEARSLTCQNIQDLENYMTK